MLLEIPLGMAALTWDDRVLGCELNFEILN